MIAMQNRRATASQCEPQRIVSERNEFLIVARSGARSEMLSIANAGVCTGLEDAAPAELSPDLVILATFVSTGPDGGEIFLVERDRPEGFKSDGRFVGGDGYLYLQQSDDDIRLKGSMRLKPGPRTHRVSDTCVLLANDRPGATVHLNAAYVPWPNELLPRGFQGGWDGHADTQRCV